MQHYIFLEYSCKNEFKLNLEASRPGNTYNDTKILKKSVNIRHSRNQSLQKNQGYEEMELLDWQRLKIINKMQFIKPGWTLDWKTQLWKTLIQLGYLNIVLGYQMALGKYQSMEMEL